MANSKITIMFNSPLQNGDIIEVQDSNLPNNYIILNWSNELPITGDVDLDIQNATQYIETNYNALNRYDVLSDYINKEITITDDLESGVQFSVISNNTNSRLTTVIENEAAPPINVNILETETLENLTDKCNLFSLRVTTNVQADKVLVTNGATEDVTTNPFDVFDVTRDSFNKKEITVRGNNSEDNVFIYVPFLETAMFDIDIEQNPSSSTITANWIGAYEPYFNLTYSVNGVNYYNSNSFSGLSEGSYTLYIKDGLGCEVQIPFVIDAFTPDAFKRTPFFKISEHNSLIYVKREEIDNCNVFRNTYNTMSYEEDTQINYRDFKQPFAICDGIRAEQFKSNYTDVSVDLIDCQGVKTNLPLTKKSNNIGVTDIRDIKISSINYLGAVFVGVSYVSGKTYDPITLDENGSYYLGASVPSFMNIKDYINIEGAGWYEVRDIVISVDNVQYLVLNSLASNFPIAVTGQTVKGTSVYNVLPYEVYEYGFDFGTLNGDYYLDVKATDNEFSPIHYATEWFNVKEEQPNTYVLQYYNSVNNDTNYSTGIRYKIRIPYSLSLTQIPNDTQEVILSDTNAYTVEADYRSFSQLETTNIPTNFAKKIGVILINDRLFLQGVSKQKNKEIEQKRIGATNTYTMTIGFVDSDYVYSNISTDGTVVDEGQVLGTDSFVQQALGVKKI